MGGSMAEVRAPPVQFCTLPDVLAAGEALTLWNRLGFNRFDSDTLIDNEEAT